MTLDLVRSILVTLLGAYCLAWLAFSVAKGGVNVTFWLWSVMAAAYIVGRYRKDRALEKLIEKLKRLTAEARDDE
jgi:hypothetical protein